MKYRIEEVQGIGPAYAAKLAAARIVTTENLLQSCCNPHGRKDVAAQTGVSESRLLRWSNMADMMRPSGIGRQFAELLEASGGDTVKELAQRNAANLAVKMAEVNGQKELAKAVPAASVITGWIEAAKTTTRTITR